MSEYSKYFPLVKLVTYTFGSIAIAVGLSTLIPYSREEIEDEDRDVEKKRDHNFAHYMAKLQAESESFWRKQRGVIAREERGRSQQLKVKYEKILERHHQEGYK